MDKSLTVVVCCFAITIASVLGSAVYIAERVTEDRDQDEKRAMLSLFESVYFKTNPHRVTVKLKDASVLEGWADEVRTANEIIITHDDDSFTVVSIEDVIYLQIHPKPPTLGDLS